MNRSRETLDDAELIVEILEFIAIKLLPVVRDQLLGDPVSIDNEPPNKALHLLGGYGCHRLYFDPFNKVVNCDHCVFDVAFSCWQCSYDVDPLYYKQP